MGTIRQFSCSACGGSWQVRLGHGMMHAVPDQVVRAFPHEMQEQVEADLRKGPMGNFSFQFQGAACLRCGEIVSVPALEVPGAGIRRTAGCPNCGGGVLLPEGDAALTCPRCGAASLAERAVGFWD